MNATLPASTRRWSVELAWRRLWWPILAISAIIPTIIGIAIAPLSFDEGYNLQVPAQLAGSGTYSTDGSAYNGEPVEFDVRISTGPTLLIPIAGLFVLFGEHIWLARLVPVAGYLLLLCLSWELGNRVAGRGGGAAAAAGVLLVDQSSLGTSASVLGELSATAFIIASALQLRNGLRVAGIFLGIAVLTKMVSILALPGFVLAIVLSSRREHLGAIALKLPLFVGWALLPILGWQTVRLMLLGPEMYLLRAQEFLQFFGHHGSGTAYGRDGRLLERITLLTSFWPPLLVVCIAAVALLVIIGARTGEESPDARAVAPSQFATVFSLCSTTALWLAWWLFFADRMWPRHVLPAVVLATALIAVWLVSRLTVRAPLSRVHSRLFTMLMALVLVTLTVETAQTLRTTLSPDFLSLGHQEEVARTVKDLDVAHAVHIDWFRNPEISLLSGKPSRQLGDDGGLLVLGPLQRSLAPDEYRGAASQCRPPIYRAGGYMVCWIRPARTDSEHISPGELARSHVELRHS